MKLFRPYERKDSAEETPERAPEQGRRRQSMVLGANREARATTTTRPADRATATATTGADAADTAAADAATVEARTRGPQPKQGPTRTRKQAEAERRERFNPSLSPKESRKLAAARAREQRVRTMTAAEAAPEKQLLRDYIDSRFNVGEFLLPSCLVILAMTFLNTVFPQITMITVGVMYAFILVVIFDAFMMWRGFKKLLAERHPNGSRKGLAFYGVNRMIQIRRLRLPKPRVKRGEKI